MRELDRLDGFYRRLLVCPRSRTKRFPGFVEFRNRHTRRPVFFTLDRNRIRIAPQINVGMGALVLQVHAGKPFKVAAAALKTKAIATELLVLVAVSEFAQMLECDSILSRHYVMPVLPMPSRRCAAVEHVPHDHVVR